MSTTNEFFTKAEMEKFTLPNQDEYRDIDSLHATISMDIENMGTNLSDKRKSTLQRNPSAYALFFHENQSILRSQNKNLTFGGISKAIAKKWEESSGHVKNEYKKRVKEMRRHELVKKAFFKATSVLDSNKQVDH